jgi:hypothetical protein
MEGRHARKEGRKEGRTIGRKVIKEGRKDRKKAVRWRDKTHFLPAEPQSQMASSSITCVLFCFQSTSAHPSPYSSPYSSPVFAVLLARIPSFTHTIPFVYDGS